MNRFHKISKQLFDSYGLREQIKKIGYKGSSEGCIVFNAVGAYLPDVNPEHYLAYLMACDGFQVKILMDDFQLEHWEYFLRTHSDDDYKFHKTLKNRILRGGYGFLSNKIFSHPNIEIVRYSTILKTIREDLPLNQGDRNHAESSVRKYFQSGEMRWEDPAYTMFFEVCLKNCQISKKVARYVEQHLKPNLYVTSHGIYSVWGPALDYLKSKGQSCLVYYPSVYRPQRISIYENTVNFITNDRSWETFRKTALSAEQKLQVEEYFRSRISGGAIDTRRYYKGMETWTLPKIEKGNAKHTFALFPNVIWDGDIVQRNTLFKSAIDWIVATVKFFSSHPESHLVLRIHPSEATILTYSQKLEPMIRARVPHLDQIKNISIISSDVKLNTYEFILHHVDVGLVFDGMIGLELPYLNKPAVLAARSRTYGSGSAFEPKTPEEYFEMLSAPADLIAKFKQQDHRENFLKFSYWYLFDRCYSLPVYNEKVYAYIDYQSKAPQLNPAINPEVSRTVDHLAGYALKRNSTPGRFESGE
ncbi:MAG: hypothetical protein AB1540_01085 [Bdellovibrionota bacterium]